MWMYIYEHVCEREYIHTRLKIYTGGKERRRGENLIVEGIRVIRKSINIEMNNNQQQLKRNNNNILPYKIPFILSTITFID